MATSTLPVSGSGIDAAHRRVIFASSLGMVFEWYDFYLYGSLALLAALSPWLYAPADRRARLAWFAGATLLAGALAVRAYMTGT